MPWRLVVLALLLLPLAYVPVHAHAIPGEGVGPARDRFRPAILPVGYEIPQLTVILDSRADGVVVQADPGRGRRGTPARPHGRRPLIVVPLRVEAGRRTTPSRTTIWDRERVMTAQP
jgi:hypothetical protein